MAAEQNFSPWKENEKRHARIISKLEQLRSIREEFAGLDVSLPEAKRTHRKIVDKLENARIPARTDKQQAARKDAGLSVSLSEAKRTHRKIVDKLENARIPARTDKQQTARKDAGLNMPLPEVKRTRREITDKLENAGTVSEPSSAAPATSAADTQRTAPEQKAAAKAASSQKPPSLAPVYEPVKKDKNESEAQTREEIPKVKYPLLFKLIAIVAVLLLVSLGTITALVSYLVSSDVQLTAELNNFSINRRNAAAMNNELKNIRAQAASFLSGVFIIESNNSGSGESLAGLFFTQNPYISALAFSSEPGELRLLTPPDSAVQSEIPPERFTDWLMNEEPLLKLAREGDTLLRNVSPYFGAAQLVMLLPVSVYAGEGERASFCAAVFFSQEDFSTILSSGVNRSFLINDQADILLHPDFELVMGAANFGSIPFIANAVSAAARSVQTVYIDENGVEYFGVFQRLSVGNTLVVTIIKRSDVFAGTRSTTRRNIVISFIVLSLSIFAITLFARRLSRQLRALTAASRKIEQGDYQLGLHCESRDEIGKLTQSFTGMGHGLENFERFTNKAVVSLARRGKLTRGGRNKPVTVSFILIRDFTKLSYKMNAAQTVGFVNEYLGLMVPCVTATGGIVDKFLTQGGVIIMAVWGAIDSAGTPAADALNCLRSMLMMRLTLMDYNRELSTRFWGYAPLIKIGCGINSGEVVAGQMGSERRMEYTIIGDTVNLAARLEGANDLFDTDILISENTMNLVKDHIITQEMGSLEVKGKTDPLRVFSVINMNSAEAAAEIFAGVTQLHNKTLDTRLKTGAYWAATMDEVRLLWGAGR